MQQKNADWNIKTVFEEDRIPQVDLVQNVMEKIRLDSSPKGGFWVKNKIGIIICLGLMLIGTTGFAAMKTYELYNEEGKIIYQEKDISKSGIPIKTPDEEMQVFMSKMVEIEENLQSGTAAAVYIKENNPQKRVVTLSQPFIYKEFSSLQQNLGNQISVKANLPGGYSFDSAIVDYLVNREYQKEDLYKLAEKTDQEYVLKPLSFSDKITSVEISYRKESDTILVRVTPFDEVEGSTVYQAEMEKRKAEKLKINDTEALYSEQVNVDDTVKEILWVHNVKGIPFLFMVETRVKSLNKDSLIKVMESLL